MSGDGEAQYHPTLQNFRERKALNQVCAAGEEPRELKLISQVRALVPSSTVTPMHKPPIRKPYRYLCAQEKAFLLARCPVCKP